MLSSVTTSEVSGTAWTVLLIASEFSDTTSSVIASFVSTVLFASSTILLSLISSSISLASEKSFSLFSSLTFTSSELTSCSSLGSSCISVLIVSWVILLSSCSWFIVFKSLDSVFP